MSGTGRLLLWRVVAIVDQLAIAAGYVFSAFESPFMALMTIPSLAMVTWGVHGVARRRPQQLSQDQLLTEFARARGLALGTVCWVVLSVLGAVLVGLTGTTDWGLLGVVGLVGFVACRKRKD